MGESEFDYERLRQVTIDGMLLIGVVLLLVVELPW